MYDSTAKVAGSLLRLLRFFSTLIFLFLIYREVECNVVFIQLPSQTRRASKTSRRKLIAI